MLNCVPVFGWILSLLVNMCLVFPLWFLWTPCGYGYYYLNGLVPDRFLTIPYWDFVAMGICLSILNVYNPLRPKVFSYTNK